MSFGDFSVQRNGGINSANGSARNDPVASLGQLLQEFQKSCILVKDRITEMRRRKVGPAEKNDLESKIRDIKMLESKIKNQLDHQMQMLDALPRQEAAPKRTALGKLQKDFERIKINMQALSSESSLIKVSHDIQESDSFNRIGNVSTPFTGVQKSVHPQDETDGAIIYPQQQMKLVPLLQGNEVDDAIMEEREKDIRKMNQDLALVNEMFKDMAVIVEKQGGAVTEIHDATEKSHQRAEAGLDQVKQAAAYQPTCTIC